MIKHFELVKFKIGRLLVSHALGDVYFDLFLYFQFQAEYTLNFPN